METPNTDPQAEQAAIEESVTLSREQAALAIGNLGLVRSIALKMCETNPYLDLDEAIGDGSYGLLRAASKFEPERGNAFTTYAYPTIRGAISQGLRLRYGEDGQKPSAFNPRDRSMESTISSESDLTLGDRLEATLADVRFTSPEGVITLVDVERAISSLPPREKDAIVSYMKGSTTMTEVGRDLGVSTARASQLFNQAAKRIRRWASLPTPAKNNSEE